MNEFVLGKIRAIIKRLKRKSHKYTLQEAYQLIRTQVKMELAFNEIDMEGVGDEIMSRLSENWPFKDVI